MSGTSVASVVGAFIVVLGVMMLALRLLRKYTMGNAAARGGREMEVLQRLALGQRQGIAVVRIDHRTFAVSMGDGGVRMLAELTETSDIPASVTGDSKGTASIGPSSIESIDSHIAAAESLLALKPIARIRNRMFAKSVAVPQRKPTRDRISYVAPIDDFKAVLSMAMNGSDHQ